MSRARHVSNISSVCTLNFLYIEMIYTFELTTDCKFYLIMDAWIENTLSFVASNSEEAISKFIYVADQHYHNNIYYSNKNQIHLH